MTQFSCDVGGQNMQWWQQWYQKQETPANLWSAQNSVKCLCEVQKQTILMVISLSITQIQQSLWFSIYFQLMISADITYHRHANNQNTQLRRFYDSLLLRLVWCFVFSYHGVVLLFCYAYVTPHVWVSVCGCARWI